MKKSSKIIYLAKNTTPFIILLLLNFFIFFDHYTGSATFPWDFLGGYHTHSYGWYNNGNIFNTIEWFPWTNLGFPSSLAIQSGGWYIPLIFTDAIGLKYTIKLATIIQSLHALIGSIGLYFFLRLFKFNKNLCLLGSICFQLTSLFFSNQQHVDIIRAYSLFPWILWAIHPETLKNNKYKIIISTIIIFQFFVVSYPGIIVSSAYCCLLYCIFIYFSINNKKDRYNYLFNLILILISSLLMSSIKWIPFFENIHLLSHGSSSLNIAPFHPIHLLTLLFNYNVDLLPSDVTMRSIYVPLVGLMGIFFICKNHSLIFNIGFLFIIMALILGGYLHTVYPNQISLPGLNISRFPLSDWRIAFTIGIIIFSLLGWNDLITGELTNRDIFFRIILFSSISAIMIWTAASVGYDFYHLKKVSIKLFIFIVAILILIFFCLILCKKPLIFVFFLFCITIFDGLFYHKDQLSPWKTPWDNSIEYSLYHYNFSNDSSQIFSRNKREARFVLNINGNFTDHINNSIYNKCWYNEEYCLFGYDNLKFSIPHSTLLKKIINNKNFFTFVTNPQQLIIINSDENFDIDQFNLDNNKKDFLSSISGVTASIVNYYPESIVYKISTPSSIKVIENEIWWDGWNYKLCSNSTCTNLIPTQPTEEYLRSWTVPPGEWSIQLVFNQKGLFLARLLCFLGIFLSIIAVYFKRIFEFFISTIIKDNKKNFHNKQLTY